MRVDDNYIFFWGGIYSNWYDVEFELGGIKFYNSEQAFMYLKALQFEDYEIMEKILETKSPKEAKKLGRLVKNFDEDHWKEIREDVMFMCLLAKFSVPELKEIILNTGDKIFVEASPYDDIWGVGLGENDKLILDPQNWGLNLLGKTLNKVRDKLRRL